MFILSEFSNLNIVFINIMVKYVIIVVNINMIINIAKNFDPTQLIYINTYF